MDRRHSGMTLVELLVVMAIVALLAGITFASVKNLTSSHEQFKCLSQLRMIHTALGMYQADELGYPPFDLDEAQRFAEETPTLDAYNVPTWSGGEPAHRTGLWILAATGHLHSVTALHCPSCYEVQAQDTSGNDVDIDDSAGGHNIRSYRDWYDSWYYCSYQNYDREAASWQYMPLRDPTVTSGPGYRRQLWDARLAVPDPVTGDASCPGLQRYSPSGDAILLWCPHHRVDNTSENRRERTLVLFKNGSVEVKDRFVDWVVAGNPAWLFPRNEADWW
ncbi:MAG TPA: type II secretion system protein [Armatimonadota bacterium]|nr:type II secretion system protein [Armatimonadota bacterium]